VNGKTADELLALFRGPSEADQAVASAALVSLGKAAAPLLAKIVNDTEEVARTRIRALKVLDKLVPVSTDATTALFAAFAALNSDVREAACEIANRNVDLKPVLDMILSSALVGEATEFSSLPVLATELFDENGKPRKLVLHAMLVASCHSEHESFWCGCMPSGSGAGSSGGAVRYREFTMWFNDKPEAVEGLKTCTTIAGSEMKLTYYVQCSVLEALQYLNNSDEKVRLEVVNGIAKLNANYLTILSLRAASKDPAQTVRAAAKAALAEIDKK
jgi:hypothetical protein